MNLIQRLLVCFCVSFCTITAANLAIAQESKQGLQGIVYEAKGNPMPMKSADKQNANGIQVTILIYPLTHQSQTIPSKKLGYYSTVNTHEIARVKTDKNGHFKIDLPIGKYSLFIKTSEGFYANLTDQLNNLAPFNVQANQYTEIKLTLQSDAIVQ